MCSWVLVVPQCTVVCRQPCGVHPACSLCRWAAEPHISAFCIMNVSSVSRCCQPSTCVGALSLPVGWEWESCGAPVLSWSSLGTSDGRSGFAPDPHVGPDPLLCCSAAPCCSQGWGFCLADPWLPTAEQHCTATITTTSASVTNRPQAESICVQ